MINIIKVVLMFSSISIFAQNGVKKELFILKDRIEYIEKISKQSDSISFVNKSKLDTFQLKTEILAKQEEAKSKVDKWIDFFSNLISEVLGAFVGAAAAIWIFVGQQKYERKKEAEKREIEEKEKMMYMKELLVSIVLITKSWSNSWLKLTEEIQKDKTEIPLLGIHVSQDIERIVKSFNNEAYFHAFLSRFKSTEDNVIKYKSISNAVDFIDSQIKQGIETQEKAINFDHARKVKYQELFQNTLDLCAEYTKLAALPNPFTKDLGEILVSFNSKFSQPTTMNNLMQYFIEPLKTTLISKWTSIQQARDLILKLKDLTTLHSDIEMQNNRHSEIAKEFSEYLLKASNDIEKQMPIFNTK